MKKNLAQIVVACFLLVGWFLVSCYPILPPPGDHPIPTGFFVTPFPSVENPMDMIETFAAQTAEIQTALALPPGTAEISATETASAFFDNMELFHVVFNDDSKVSFDRARLEALPTANVFLENQALTGIPLLTVLNEAGWNNHDVCAVSIQGIGSITIPKEKLDENSLLVIMDSSVWFASPLVSKSDWMHDVTIITLY